MLSPAAQRFVTRAQLSKCTIVTMEELPPSEDDVILDLLGHVYPPEASMHFYSEKFFPCHKCEKLDLHTFVHGEVLRRGRPKDTETRRSDVRKIRKTEDSRARVKMIRKEGTTTRQNRGTCVSRGRSSTYAAYSFLREFTGSSVK